MQSIPDATVLIDKYDKGLPKGYGEAIDYVQKPHGTPVKSPLAVQVQHPYIPALRETFRVIVLYEKKDFFSSKELRETLVELIDTYTKLFARQGIENSHIVIARYMIATFCDEMIGGLPWKDNNIWADDSLLYYYHKETYGGEKFFKLITLFLQDPVVYINHIELAYVCLSLGYKGKYAMQDESKSAYELDAIRNELFSVLQNHVKSDSRFYDRHCISQKRNPPVMYIPIKWIVFIALIVLSIIYTMFTIDIAQNEEELLRMISEHKSIELKEKRTDEVL